MLYFIIYLFFDIFQNIKILFKEQLTNGVLYCSRGVPVGSNMYAIQKLHRSQSPNKHMVLKSRTTGASCVSCLPHAIFPLVPLSILHTHTYVFVPYFWSVFEYFPFWSYGLTECIFASRTPLWPPANTTVCTSATGPRSATWASGRWASRTRAPARTTYRRAALATASTSTLSLPRRTRRQSKHSVSSSQSRGGTRRQRSASQRRFSSKPSARYSITVMCTALCMICAPEVFIMCSHMCLSHTKIFYFEIFIPVYVFVIENPRARLLPSATWVRFAIEESSGCSRSRYTAIRNTNEGTSRSFIPQIRFSAAVLNYEYCTLCTIVQYMLYS